MTGLDHKRADIETREKFALTKEKTQQILESLNMNAVLISTCNRTEFYTVALNNPSKILCDAIGRDYGKYSHLFTERSGEEAFVHLCRMASGLDSQITGDDQIITQAREALEFSRTHGRTDSYLETAFRFAIQAAKAIKTKVILKTLGIGSAPSKAVEKLKTLHALSGSNAIVIGNGRMGRLVSEILISEKVNVTITLREYKKGIIQVPHRAHTVNFSKRYEAIEEADIVVSATTSPHFTLHRTEFSGLSRLPKFVVDLAIPRDVEPSIGEMPGVVLLTIDDISAEGRVLPPSSASLIDGIISEHITRYHRWLNYKQRNQVG